MFRMQRKCLKCTILCQAASNTQSDGAQRKHLRRAVLSQDELDIMQIDAVHWKRSKPTVLP